MESSDSSIEKADRIRPELDNGAKQHRALQEYVEPSRPRDVGSSGYSNPDEYWRILARHKVTVLCFALGGLAAAILVSLLQRPLYRARISLEVQDFNEDFMDMKSVDPTRPSTERSSTADTYLDTQIQIMQSDSLIERVIDQLNLHDPKSTGRGLLSLGGWRILGWPNSSRLPEKERMIRQAQAGLTVRAAGGTRLLEVLYKSPDPKLAADFANTLVTEFVKQNQEIRWKSTEGTGEWLTSHLSEMKIKLEQSQAQLQAYARTSGLTFMEKENVAVTRLKELQDQLSAAQADRVTKQAKFDEEQNKPVDSLPEVLDDPGLREYNQKLTDLQRQLAELSATLTPAHYKVQRVQAQIVELQSAVQRERSQILRRIGNEYRATSRREKLLADAYANQEKIVANQSSKSIHYDTLKGEVDSNRQIYEGMLQRIKQAELASAMRASNVLVVDHAKPPFLPYEPNVPMNLAIGLFSGLFLGLGFVLIRNGLHARIVAPGDAQTFLNLPELGSIPMAEIGPAPSNKKLPERGVLLGRAQLTAGTAQGNEPELATWKRKQSLLAECFRATLTSILLPDPSGGYPQVMLLTSPAPGDGKTTVASNLAVAMAEIGRKVLLIDSDLHRPRLHQVFGMPATPGLTDILSADTRLETIPLARLVRQTKISGLHLLPSGTNSAGTSNSFYSPRMAMLLGRMRTEFDMVLIDAAPMVHLADPRVLGRLTDGVILVVSAGRTSPESALFACQRFAGDGTRVLGTILNNWNPRNNQGYYGSKEYFRTYEFTEK